jgi:uncharacterized membrane protein YqhA
MGTVDFTALKLKLISSIVAISGISLLRSFLKIGDGPLDEAAKPLVYFNRGGICWDQR